MPSKKAGYSVRLWISPEDIERLKALSEKTELSQVELMTRILHSGLEAVVDNGYRLSLPLKFTISEAKTDCRGRQPVKT